ncbi:MFS transporter [Rhodococcus opacus]|uniref:MFS transporter n=1 Tax=Rhodococcus opacus TaxID=37919 RepID=UPI001C493E8D|nr:MFS transporter [Rhodococcus opacus]MBV6760389.1 MFS transporter [Rhodococcus opacus]
MAHTQSEHFTNPTPSADTRWFRQVSPTAWNALLVAGLGWTFEAFDVGLFALTLSAISDDFGVTKAETGIVAAVQVFGMIIGGVASGFAADKFGRKRALIAAITVYSIFTGFTALAPSLEFTAGARFLAGLGFGASWTAGAALVAETWPARHRGKGGGIMQAGLPVGTLLDIGASFLVSQLHGGLEDGGWRYLYLIGALPIVLAAYTARYVSESPIWLEGRIVREKSSTFTQLFRRPSVKPLAIGFVFVFFIHSLLPSANGVLKRVCPCPSAGRTESPMGCPARCNRSS